MREFLIKARSNLGFTQEQVAQKSEISRTHYNQIENGMKSPSVKVAKKISNTLQVEWTIFFTK